MISGVRYVYFAQCDFGGPIKIGLSYTPEHRIPKIQRDFPFTLKLLGEVPNASAWHERFLHTWFRHLHIRSEWFNEAPEIHAVIAEANAKGRLDFIPLGPPPAALADFEALQEKCEHHGFTTEMIAERMGVCVSYVESFFRQYAVPHEDKFRKTSAKFIAAVSALLVKDGHDGDLRQFIIADPRARKGHRVETTAAPVVAPHPRDSYLRATARLLFIHGKNCYARFNVAPTRSEQDAAA